MGLGRIAVVMATLVATLPLAACTVTPAPAPDAVVAGHARYPVGLRELRLTRGDRPLRTVLLYPAAGPAGRPMWTDAVPAAGKFPLVLFSHGMSSSPERYLATAASWTAAGFVVALPAYPHTGSGVVTFRRKDIVNQPRDAAFVILKVRALGRKAGDPLHGRIDGNRVAAVGHSAGGYTTTGLFHAGHAAWLRAGVVLAGWLAPGAFHGPPATMLFVQGDSDSVVPVAQGRAAYDKVPWSKSFVLLHHSSHAQYMLPGRRGYPEMDSLVTDFLRWTLTDDEAAHRRLPPSAFPVDESS